MSASWRLAVAAILTVAACGSGTAGARTPQASPTTPLDQLSTAPPAGCPAGRTVYDSDELKIALKSAQPGTTILLAPGRYTGNFAGTTSGSAAAPITVCGTRDAILDGGSIHSGYVFHLDGASWWNLIGFSVENGQKGVMTDHASNNLISGLYVHGIGDEGIHLRAFSSDNTIENNTVRDTGRLTVKFGEGIYVGSAHSNWCTYTSCNPDNSDRNVITGNDISNTRAENIDIKEGTSSGQILNNRLSGQGMDPSAATAWINVKGNDWIVKGNVGHNSVKDGFQVHQVYAGWGTGNTFQDNHAEVDGPGYGFYVQFRSLGTVLACSNTAVAAGAGFSNIVCNA